jgi:NRAMP (natural resistance-associated macrophage protein)-like metal ion transporter
VSDEERARTGEAQPDASLEEQIARERRGWKRWLLVVGPGVVTGASDDDPSGVATYAIAGASFGYATLWVTLLCLPLMASVQFISAKVAMVRGQGMARVLSKRFPRWVVYPSILALAIANTLNAGADIGAIGAAVNLIVPIPIAATIIPIALAIALLQIFASYRLIASVFKWLALALVAYIATALFVRADVLEVLHGTFVPTVHLNSAYLATLVALLGTTVSPYLWFWQSGQEVDEEISQGRSTLRRRRGASDAELKYKAWDVNVGMVFSELVAYFIIFVTAATLFQAGQRDIQSATDAAEALKPLAGAGAKYLLAFGLFGSGLLAVPVLTGSAAYSVSEVAGWRSSLNEKPKRAKGLYGVIIASTAIGMLINFVGINPIDALFYSAVLNGLIAPPLLVLIMLVGNDSQLLGERSNSWVTNLFGWLTVALMSAGAVVLIASWLLP